MMRPFGRVAARIDSLIAGTNSQGRANHFVCRQCQERLRTRPTRTSLLGRATFSTRSPQRREFDAPESRDRDTSDVSRTDSENWEGLKWIGSKEWIEAREARQVTHDTYVTVYSVHARATVNENFLMLDSYQTTNLRIPKTFFAPYTVLSSKSTPSYL